MTEKTLKLQEKPRDGCRGWKELKNYVCQRQTREEEKNTAKEKIAHNRSTW